MEVLEEVFSEARIQDFEYRILQEASRRFPRSREA